MIFVVNQKAELSTDKNAAQMKSTGIKYLLENSKVYKHKMIRDNLAFA